MIDFHNHILPDIDDGSRSINMTLNMLKEAEKQGITEVINTVHFQHPKMAKKHITFESISKVVNNLQYRVKKEKINIKIHIGSEVYFKHNLIEILDNPLSTMSNKKFMLIEFPVLQFPSGYMDELFNIQLKGVTPIIAHPERYREINSNINIVEEFINRGFLIQVDSGSIIGHFGEDIQKTANMIIELGWFHLIGSDAHNDKSRNFCLDKCIDFNPTIRNNKNLIFIEHPKKIINGESIENRPNYKQVNKSKLWHKIKTRFGI